MIVNEIKLKEVKKKLKECPKEVVEYVEALERSNERWKYLNEQAVKKIYELTEKK